MTKQKLNYIYFAIIGICILATLVGISFIGETKSLNEGYRYLLFALQTISITILPILLLTYSCHSISSEIESGTIRNLLTCTHSKATFLTSKIITSLFFQILIMTFSVLIIFLIANSIYGFRDISEDGIIILSKWAFWLSFSKAYVLLFLVLSTMVFLGLFVSLISPTNFNATGISILLYLLLETIKTPLHINKIVFSSYIEIPLNLLSEQVEGFPINWQLQIHPLLTASLSWIAFFLTASFLIIKKREFR